MENSRPNVIDPEVLPPQRLGQVNWDMKSTLCSPFFWFILGGLTVGAGIYFFQRQRR
jgi:hypothetical protein